MEYTISGLTPGVIYKFASLAINSQGESEMSHYVLIGATELPPAPTNLYKKSLLSN
jgi:hypothetical protein